MTKSPKETFLESAHKKELERITETAAFQAACDYALLELMQGMPAASDPARGWDSFSKIDGARQVIEILRTLWEPVKKPVPLKSPTLNYNTNQAH